MPNTVLILNKNEPLTFNNFPIIPTSCPSNISTVKNNLLGCWNDPLHSLVSPSRLSSYVMHNLRRAQDPSQRPLPTKISASTSSPRFAGFVMKSQISPCLMLGENESHSPPWNPSTDAGHHKSWTRAEGLCFLGLEGLWFASHLYSFFTGTCKENKHDTSNSLADDSKISHLFLFS